MPNTRTDQEIKEMLDALDEVTKISGMRIECVAVRDGDTIIAAWHPSIVRELRRKCDTCTRNTAKILAELAERVFFHRMGD
jgi:hypothetical protein